LALIERMLMYTVVHSPPNSTKHYLQKTRL